MSFNPDWHAFSPRLGFRVILSVAIGAAIANLFGLDTSIFALAAVVISMSDFRGSIRDRLLNVLGFTVILGIITALAWFATGAMWPVVISITVVTLVGGFALAYKTRFAMEASFLSVWLVILLPGFGSETLGSAVAATLLAGAFVAVFMVAFLLILPGQSRSGAKALAKLPENPTTHEKPHITLRSPVTTYAVSKSLAAGLATLIGWLIVGAHPFWATWAPLMIIKPSLHETASKGVNRVIGTLLGGAVGYLIIVPISNEKVIAVLFLVAVFLQFATTKVHYALMVFFLTLELVLSGTLSGGVPASLSLDRLAATIIGVVISFATVVVLSRVLPREDDSGPRHHY